MNTTLIVYGTVGLGTEIFLGQKVPVKYQAVKRIHLDTWQHDNGYQINTGGVYHDAQGREYKEHIEIDYYAGRGFVREDGLWFHNRPGPGPSRNAVTLEEL